LTPIALLWKTGSLGMADERVNNPLQETDLWRERYRVLFDQNVAGVVLTTVDGRIVDCNQPCAQILGFDSREEMLGHWAWDFYFQRAEREIVVQRLRAQCACPAEEVCLRQGNGMPVWVLATRAVASFVEGQPELLQGTLIDITAQKKAQADLRNVKDTSLPDSIGIADLSQRLTALLGRVNRTLQATNLRKTDRAEIRDCVLALDEIKTLMSELEILRLFPER
jgi:PAS domain S-box-containing protein